MAEKLNRIGIGRNDRVAMALPNGPEMAVAFLAVASCATSAPLNPACRADEFEFYLSDLQPKALMIQSDLDSPARAVAKARGIPVIELSPHLEEEAGIFELAGEVRKHAMDSIFARPEDLASILLTSGTTSRSKQVPLTQAYICTSADRVRSALQLDENDRCLSIMPLFHVHGLIGALLSSVAAGATVICAPALYAPKFFEWLEKFQPTWYTAVPTMHQAILARAAANSEIIARCPLRFIRSSSAPLPPQLMAQLESTFNAPVIETYGLTEAFQITCNPLPPRERKAGSVGVPESPEDIAITDPDGVIRPRGEIGEIVIRETKVVRGYENNPTANEGVFQNHWFKTGDQGFLDDEGYLFITGRLKEIINRGGEQISPYEIEQVLLDHPAVAQAVSFAVPDTRLGEDIAAAVVLRDDASATADDIRRFVAARVANFKVPNQVLFLDAIPKTSTGKPQRVGLAERLGIVPTPRHQEAVEFVSPRTAVEKMLAGIWVEILGIERVGIHDDFFQLGGDSILAAQLVSRIRKAAQVDVPLVTFFEARTVADMARGIEEARLQGPSSQASSIEPSPRTGELSLSFGQERFWFLNELEPSNPAYHVPIVLSLVGPLHVVALEQSINEILRRHEALRTTFHMVDGRPVQKVDSYHAVTLAQVDLRKLSETEREAKALELSVAEANRPFDLTRGPLFRSTLLRLGEEESRLLVTVHHIVFDGWSLGIFFQELSVLYEAFCAGRAASLPDLRIHYADFARWQLERQGEIVDQQLAYWKRQLRGGSPLLELPINHPRPTVRSYRGARRFLTLSGSLAAAIKALGEQQGATLFMTLLAAFQSLLHRYSGQDDVSVGSPIANRNQVETEGLIGLFINTLVLRTNLSGNPTFLQLLSRVRETVLGARAHQELPFERLVAELQPERRMNQNPLFQVMFLFQNAPAQPPKFRDLTVSRLGLDRGTALQDLTLELREGRNGLDGFIEYDTDLFDSDTIDRMVSHFQALLEGIAANPNRRISDLPILPEAERRRLLVEWNETKRYYPKERCVHQLFEEQARRTPEAVAVVFEDQQLTYRELDTRANQLAHRLQALGVGPGTLVGICVERSLQMVVGLLAALKAGGAYVPLDPGYPKERLAFMLEGAVTVLLTQQRLLDLLPDHQARVVCLDTDWETIERESRSKPASDVTSDNLAYVIFTSGSTGKPKGVEIPHRAVVNFLHSMREEPGLTEQDTLLSVTTLSFDIAALEIFLPLTVGARVVVISRETASDGSLLADKLAQCGATAMQATPVTWRLLLEAGWQGSKHLTVLCGGEALPRELADSLMAKGSSLWNLYGPTETTIWSALRRVDSKDRRISIGHPIANTQIYILDSHLQPVPIGVPGDLYIGGDGLARGYLNRPDLTQERFITNPFSDEPGARLYKTGDLGRYFADGNIEFLGRIDGQVKIRGFRIELGEIENVLAQVPGVREAVVLAREDTPGEKRLVAYMVPDGKLSLPTGELRTFLSEKLPEYMVPAAFVALERLPLTPNGKVDRGALPAPDTSKPELSETFVAPRNSVEEELAGIWAELLKVERVGVHDSFFDLGGYSLLAIRAIARVRQAFGIALSLRALFENPTVAGLAAQVDQLRVNVEAPKEMATVLAEIESLSDETAEQLVSTG
jgi:amino acid adenylation domain-containing protein